MARILVALSGGVDSTAAASLLLERGHACAGAHLSLFEKEDEEVRAIARQLGIPFHVFDMRERFERDVVAHFAESYLRGETPNPGKPR